LLILPRLARADLGAGLGRRHLIAAHQTSSRGGGLERIVEQALLIRLTLRTGLGQRTRASQTEILLQLGRLSLLLARLGQEGQFPQGGLQGLAVARLQGL